MLNLIRSLPTQTYLAAVLLPMLAWGCAWCRMLARRIGDGW